MDNTHYRSLPVQKQFHLSDNWELIKTEANQYSSPSQMTETSNLEKIAAVVPGSVAMAVNQTESNRWEPSFIFENFDWWYLYSFNSLEKINQLNKTRKLKLHFSGLATLSEVWLNNIKLISTDNMFRQYSIDLIEPIKLNDQLTIVFRSINKYLEKKQPRPRWKTKLVKNQQMRWLRCTMLGQIEAWTPPFQIIGPWREIYIEPITEIEVQDFIISSNVSKELPVINTSFRVIPIKKSNKIVDCHLIINNSSFVLNIENKKDIYYLSITQQLTNIKLWWPHTHGEPCLYEYQVIIEMTEGKRLIRSGKIGFKSVEFLLQENKSELTVNKQTIFCRGTCWTVSDYLSLNASKEILTKQLTLMRDSGLNMIRVGGTMIYESDDFYQLCDQLGILVWQDFMFASMDYPIDNEDFLHNIQTETEQQLNRLNQFVCISNYCGNTDVQAQAAMYGMPKEMWSNHFFDQWLANSCSKLHPGIPYLSSSPSGGALPFHLSTGISHYWGVGAYMHPANDSDKTRVLFASEGMGLSHIPEDETIKHCTGKGNLYPYNNDWVKRIPRDLGAGWDFNDIRDNYLKELFSIDPIRLRRQNVERYMAISKIVTGEVISKIFEYWRSDISLCQGGLIWFNRDFWPCAGFGLIDSNNNPKAAYFQIKRAWSKLALFIHNDGLDGASIKIINDTNQLFGGLVEFELIKNSNTLIAKSQKKIQLKKHHQLSLSVDQLLGKFFDTGYAYKFGNPQFDVICCRLKNEAEQTVAESFMFSENLNLPIIESAKITSSVKTFNSNTISLNIVSDKFLQFVKINCKHYQPSDNYFHLAPGVKKNIELTKVTKSNQIFKARLEAINLKNTIKIEVNDET